MDVTIAGDAILRPLNDDQMGRVSIDLAAFDGEIGTGAVPIDDPDADDEYRGGRQLRIDEGPTLLIDGFIADQDRVRGPVPVVNREVVYGLEDPNALLFAQRAVRVRQAETDVARVLAFAELDLPSGTVTSMVLNANTATLPKKRYDGEGWAELITDVVDMTGKTLFLHDTADGDRCLHYHLLTEGHNCGLTISDATAQTATIYNPWNPQKTTSPADLGNDILFVDQTGRTATYTDATSITNHDADGLAHERIIRVEADSQSHLDAIAASQGAETRSERFTWRCTIGPLDEDALALIRVGDLITTTSQVMGLTAAAKRIAHMTLALAKDVNNRVITGWWMATLELGAPVRRPWGKGRSLPKPTAIDEVPQAAKPWAGGCDVLNLGTYTGMLGISNFHGFPAWINGRYLPHRTPLALVGQDTSVILANGGTATLQIAEYDATHNTIPSVSVILDLTGVNEMYYEQMVSTPDDASDDDLIGGMVTLRNSDYPTTAPVGALQIIIDWADAGVSDYKLRLHVDRTTPFNIPYTDWLTDLNPVMTEGAWVSVRVKWEDGLLKVNVWPKGFSEPTGWMYDDYGSEIAFGPDMYFELLASGGIPPAHDGMAAHWQNISFSGPGIDCQIITHAQQYPWTFIGTGDGVEDEFSFMGPYAPGSLEVLVDGVPQDVEETNPATGAFTLGFVPEAGETIRARAKAE